MSDSNESSTVSIAGSEKELNDMLDNEKTRLNFLENIIKALYNKRITLDQEKGTMSVDITAGELSQLIKAESELFDLRRKLNGALD